MLDKLSVAFLIRLSIHITAMYGNAVHIRQMVSQLFCMSIMDDR